MTTDPSWASLPDGLPVPVDDDAATRLHGAVIPSLALPSTQGTLVDLSSMQGLSVVFFFPRTGQPGQPDLTPDWDSIPGARGCTPQVCGFCDAHAEFQSRGYRVFGLSTQDTAYQREMAERLRLPYPILSDADLRLVRAMNLPTLYVGGQTLIRRMSWIVVDAQIRHVFYPVFPPDRSAAEVLTWLDQQR